MRLPTKRCFSRSTHQRNGVDFRHRVFSGLMHLLKVGQFQFKQSDFERRRCHALWTAIEVMLVLEFREPCE